MMRVCIRTDNGQAMRCDIVLLQLISHRQTMHRPLSIANQTVKPGSRLVYAVRSPRRSVVDGILIQKV